MASRRGFFEMAAKTEPKPQTVAIIAADAEFAQAAAQGAREELEEAWLQVIYDKSIRLTPRLHAVSWAV